MKLLSLSAIFLLAARVYADRACCEECLENCTGRLECGKDGRRVDFC
ncbi:hypothetical protein HYFRA_00000890 [Hymenoscyphus fraxineus]|uniref:Uncharacterized protein n=1 Tax=Hymenoscyphus fraxineus TaxID=746836 RepID=A0A9N9KRH1_9HELO|nr:hypothetical protein HYFRA_00000890 [Hymenoscyphus fraxineus]